MEEIPKLIYDGTDVKAWFEERKFPYRIHTAELFRLWDGYLDEDIRPVISSPCGKWHWTGRWQVNLILDMSYEEYEDRSEPISNTMHLWGAHSGKVHYDEHRPEMEVCCVEVRDCEDTGKALCFMDVIPTHDEAPKMFGLMEKR